MPYYKLKNICLLSNWDHFKKLYKKKYLNINMILKCLGRKPDLEYKLSHFSPWFILRLDFLRGSQGICPNYTASFCGRESFAALKLSGITRLLAALVESRIQISQFPHPGFFCLFVLQFHCLISSCMKSNKQKLEKVICQSSMDIRFIYLYNFSSKLEI